MSERKEVTMAREMLIQGMITQEQFAFVKRKYDDIERVELGHVSVACNCR